MFGITQTCTEVSGIRADNIPDWITRGNEPVILRGLVAHWPLVAHGHSGPIAAMDYLRSFYNGRPTMIYHGASDINGRYFYNDNATALNYTSTRGSVTEMLEQVARTLEDTACPSLYIASNQIDTHFPGLRDYNDITLTPATTTKPLAPPLASIWIGNRSLASCHFDTLYNIACCAVGRRRLALFPPEQIANLYPGPLETTPGGQVISMVDFHQPDYARYPRFREAQAAGKLAELAPGDAIFIPTMWWHQVEGLAPFNVLINYWWNPSARYLDNGMSALLHAMLAIRDKTSPEKAAFKALFDYYIFNDAPAGDHLPEEARGMLSELDEATARQLRAMLVNQLNR